MKNQTEKDIIDSAKNTVVGTDFALVTKYSEFVDERGFPRRIKFNAVEFTAADGTRKYIGTAFL